MSLESLKEVLKNHKSILLPSEIQEIERILDSAKERLSESSTLKEKGNKAYQEKEYLDAIDFYTKAIHIDPTNELFYSNRAAAYAKINCPESGIDDSKKAVQYNPWFVTGYLRLGDFYKGTDNKKSLFYYQVGLLFDPKNDKLVGKVDGFKEEGFFGKEEAKEAMKSGEFKDLFSKVMEDEELMEKLKNLNKK